MSRTVRGNDAELPPRGFGAEWFAIPFTTLAFAGIAGIAGASGQVFSQVDVEPMSAAIAGFLGSGAIVALRTLRTRGPKPSQFRSAKVAMAAALQQPDPDTPASAPNDRMTRTDVGDLVRAIGRAGVSRIVLPVGPSGDAREAVVLARRLSAKRNATVLVDFGVPGLAQETGLIDPANDVREIAASPQTFAHSIHRDRASGAHVIAAEISVPASNEAAVAAAAAIMLEALGEAYGRTVVAIPADRLLRLEGLIGADTAVVVPATSAGDAEVRLLLDEFQFKGIKDVVLLDADANQRSRAAA